MSGWSAAGLWRRICAALLCLALTGTALSAPDPIHSADDNEASHMEHRAMPEARAHNGPETAPADHDCHPGLDCFLQAIVTAQAMPEPQHEIGRLSRVAYDRGRKGTIRGSDPPPPRVLS